MRITMLALGSRGDIQPYVALGLGLQAAGHEVCLATHASYETFIRHHGLTFFPVAGDLQAIYASLDGEALLDTGRNLVGFMRRLIRLAAPLAHQVLTDLWHACQGAEAIIYSILAFAGYHMAQELGILAYAACLQP